MSRHSESAAGETSGLDDSLPLGRGVRVLAADPNGLLALEKPAQLLSHPNTARDHGKSLLRALYDLDAECYQWEGGADSPAPGRLWLLNRLDSATSGVILGAVDPAVAAAVRREFAAGRVKKTYLALVFGTPRRPRESWTDSLAVERRNGKLRTRDGGNRRATAEAILEKRFSGPQDVSLITLVPGTGRTHQLRVQCARRGLPIVGDKTYGRFRANREFVRITGDKRLFLHCAATSLAYTHNGRTFRFEARAAVPDVFDHPFGKGDAG